MFLVSEITMLPSVSKGKTGILNGLNENRKILNANIYLQADRNLLNSPNSAKNLY